MKKYIITINQPFRVSEIKIAQMLSDMSLEDAAYVMGVSAEYAASFLEDSQTIQYFVRNNYKEIEGRIRKKYFNLPSSIDVELEDDFVNAESWGMTFYKFNYEQE